MKWWVSIWRLRSCPYSAKVQACMFICFTGFTDCNIWTPVSTSFEPRVLAFPGSVGPPLIIGVEPGFSLLEAIDFFKKLFPYFIVFLSTPKYYVISQQRKVYTWYFRHVIFQTRGVSHAWDVFTLWLRWNKMTPFDQNTNLMGLSCLEKPNFSKSLLTNS